MRRRVVADSQRLHISLTHEKIERESFPQNEVSFFQERAAMRISPQEVRVRIREVRTDEHKVGPGGFGMMLSKDDAPSAKSRPSIDQHEKKIDITDISSGWTRVSYDRTPCRDGKGCGDTDLFQP